MFENQIKRLVEKFSVNSWNTSDIEFDRTRRNITRLLSSNTQYNIHESYENIVQKLSHVINKSNKNGPEKSLYFLKLAQNLQESTELNKKYELLKLLELLSENKTVSDLNLMSSYNNNNNNTIVKKRPYASNKLAIDQYITNLSMNPIHRIDAPMDFEGLLTIKGEIVDELLLIRDILYASQGIQTELIEIRNNEFRAKSNLRLLPSQKILISKLLRVGILHEKLNIFLKEKKRIGSETKLGLVLQSFLGCIDCELTNLYELFGYLHDKLLFSFDENCLICDKMTLERLNIWFSEPLIRLELLYKFCLSINGLHGGQIISQIYKFIRTGNEFEYNFTELILNEICRPIFDMINKWIIRGILCDPFNEFFIFENESIENLENMENEEYIWKRKYILIRKFIPIFINKKLAKQIYSIGRNLNFICVCCKEMNNNIGNYFSYINISNFTNLNKFETEISKLSHITNKKLMELMMNKFSLMSHFEALRKYLLLGQGDFIEEFLIEIRDELNKNASHIKQHLIQSKLESAIVNSNALYENASIKKRLCVKILNNCNGEIGWNVFTLTYSVELPINIIFNKIVLKKYECVFVFLMKIKLAKSVLNDCWKNQMRGNHKISEHFDIYYIKHCSYLIRNSMNILLQIFESYFMFDVLDTSWKEFKYCCNKIENIDELITIHNKYINQIITKCFLNVNDEKQLQKPLQDILIQIHQFTNIYNQLFLTLNNIQLQRNNENLTFTDQKYNIQYQLLRKKQNEIIYILKSFHNKIYKLLELTKNCNSNHKIPEYLERLLVQLDFNDYFSIHHTQNKQIPIDLPINPLPIQSNNTSNSTTDMISKLDAVLNKNKIEKKTFVPNFVFPKKIKKKKNNNNNNNNHFEKHRTTAPSTLSPSISANDNNNIYKSEQENIHENILSKYNLIDNNNNNNQPKIDSTIPKYLLPTPLKKNKNNNNSNSNSNDITTKYLFDDSIINLTKNNNSKSKTKSPKPGFENDPIINTNAIQFTFNNNNNENKNRSNNNNNNNDLDNNDQWSRFIPTPLINQGKKTKSYR